MSRREPTTRLRVQRVDAEDPNPSDDEVATEEPLEIRVVTHGGRDPPRSLAVTMRTPGHDVELAAGFLFTEGIVRSRSDLLDLRHFKDDPRAHGQNVVEATLAESAAFDEARLQRNFYMTSSCGVCGKSSIDAVRVAGATPSASRGPRLPQRVVASLPERMREGQAVFASTGGLHAAGLFDAEGRIVTVREDVGRHNAVDKVIGERFLADRTPIPDHGLVVSGRASFEILQKAAVAGVPFVVAVGAPSSLAVELANEFGMTLVGFARGTRFNVYAGAHRVLGLRPRPEAPAAS